MKTCIIVWGNWGPYHYARFRGFESSMEKNGYKAVGLEIFGQSGLYEWKVNQSEAENVIHLNLGDSESSFPLRGLVSTIPSIIKKFKPTVAFLPSYWHWSLFLNLMFRNSGSKIVMMNESHRGTVSNNFIKTSLKKLIVRRFHGAFVGGAVHRNYFNEMGIPNENIKIGYDSIDNELFAIKAKKARMNASDTRRVLGLPDRYFLSLSRIIEKKNLPRLIEAFAKVKPSLDRPPLHLVIVGSGDQEETVKKAVVTHGLPKIEHPLGREREVGYDPAIPAVHFYGFRQIDQNPQFYALAECFIMPSIFEEWGLVVNEAMACSIPCITSSVAGCAEDLIKEGETGFTFPWNDVNALYLAMNMFNLDPHLSKKLGENAFSHIQNFGCDFFGEQAVSLANKVLESK